MVARDTPIEHGGDGRDVDGGAACKAQLACPSTSSPDRDPRRRHVGQRRGLRGHIATGCSHSHVAGVPGAVGSRHDGPAFRVRIGELGPRSRLSGTESGLDGAPHPDLGTGVFGRSASHRPNLRPSGRLHRGLRLGPDRRQPARCPSWRPTDLPWAAWNARDPDAPTTARSPDLAGWRCVAAGPAITGPRLSRRIHPTHDRQTADRAHTRCFRLTGTIARIAPRDSDRTPDRPMKPY